MAKDYYNDDTNIDSNVIVITIKDNGVGIDKDVLPILFTKFASKSFQGTGLGLYICKSIVELMVERFGLKTMKTEKVRHFPSVCLLIINDNINMHFWIKQIFKNL